MPRAAQRTDRRIQRTRQLLQRAFEEILHEKNFVDLTIQDITERANLNRGTFYIHFEDKYRLLDVFVREKFRQLMATRAPSPPQWNRQTLHVLIQTVLLSLETKYKHQRYPSQGLANISPLLEQAIREEVTAFLCACLQQATGSETGESIAVETMARIASWAIFGTALQWSQEPLKISSEQMANDILRIVMDGLSSAGYPAIT